ncbi:flagellar motor protein MotA [Desulfosporosinus sp. HMP52]|uniref:Chemotaxis protein MotA n=1 Tax=Desulfosporosinus hippei DSM 8344 TaxID=1121419 RepID=A0A1G7Y2C4_9FIRM|nr:MULTISPECIES: flagellar motor stator protein MotA [Desulfosporosinus]KGK82887.1 flagellar motor protein MotA [Desulfosporosinus sp. HMP52]SDG90652.1 chemotaxis protein MotA [Desulfosporosinus hippei DSM 8344]
MEKSTYIGLVLAVIAVGVGMVLKGASLSSLVNPAAILIIFVGTAATIFIGFPLDELKAVPKLFKILFTSQVLISRSDLINQIGEWATVSRREGLLSLESKAEEIEDEFLRNGMRMVIDGNDPEFIREVLMENISAMEDRHRQGALIFTQAGTYAPTLGVLGAVVGLIAALGNLNEVEKLGHLISAAFVATLLGIFSGYVLWHPMANKLKQKSKKETQIKMMMAEGLLAIQAGEPVLSINQRLAVFLTPSERQVMEGEKGEKA